MNNLHLLDQSADFCKNVMLEKYAQKGEVSADQIFNRVAIALAQNNPEKLSAFQSALRSGFVPGGRINSALGSGTITTAINCFVQPVGDTMSGVDRNGLPGILEALRESAETMRRGGGVGYDFSPIRPFGSVVKGTNSRASGPVSYMRVFDRTCETVESAGARRGAQMGVLRVDHPDIFLFIDSKKSPQFTTMGLPQDEAGALTAMMREHGSFAWQMRKSLATLSNFNISVAVTNEFMEALLNDGDFDLVHEEPPFDASAKQKVCTDGKMRWIYKTVKASEIWQKIMQNTYNDAEPGVIFIDTANNVNNLHYCEKIATTNPCGEQLLPAYGSCDLGSIDLSKFVVNPFEDNVSFDFDAYEKVIHTGVQMLDLVLDLTNWPLERQKKESDSKRRIGLGYFGLADAMAMMNIRYDSQAGVDFAEAVTRVLRDEAYKASIEIAKEKGAFPLFDVLQYLKEGTFASTLPDAIKNDIRTYGIRNSHLLSLAPTGTISMAFGNNASSGIEPIFSLCQERTKVMMDGTRQPFILNNNAYNLFRKIKGDTATPSMFTTTNKMTVDHHLAVLEVVAPLIDSAISKTVNVPESYSFEDFKHVYMRAWKAGIKGITTYRPNPLVGSVLRDAAEIKKNKVKVAEVSDLNTKDPLRRITLKTTSNVKGNLRWPKRPVMPHGVPSSTYRIKHHGGDFALVVSHLMNGKAHPLECYVAGNEQPRGLAAIAKIISVDMRADDSAWLKMKLDSLLDTQADDAFDMVDPFTGNHVRYPSLISGVARLIGHAMTNIGVFTDEEPSGQSPMIDALFSKKEPKTGSQGCLTWSFDIRNDSTKDDFLMTIKEVHLPDGSIRPYSVWLSGKYPKVLDGLTKILSIDMRVSELAWVVLKLRKLLNFVEPRGDFWAEVPGEQRQQSYPSTVAYMAALLLERYRVLGLLDGDIEMSGTSKQSMQSPSQDEKIEDDTYDEEAKLKGTGMLCPKCFSLSLHRADGCFKCFNCKETSGCGG